MDGVPHPGLAADMRFPVQARHAATPLLLLLAGCGRVTDADKQAAVATVRRNLDAMNAGDIDAMMATMHPRSPVYAKMPDLARSIAEKFKLKYVLEKAEVETAAPDAIRVGFVQVTHKVSGEEDFPDNRVFGTHLLRRDGDAWKIWDTQARRMERLDEAAGEEK